MTTVQALIIALLQGVTELFPVSSLGHAVILPALLHWNLNEHDASFLPFLVMLHVGTAAALLLFFWRDWLALGKAATGFGTPSQIVESRHILKLLITATIPAVLIGYVFESFLRNLFGTPEIAAVFLVMNGMVLLVADRLRVGFPAGSGHPIAQMTQRDALIIGCWQCMAFLPGISRSGATIAGGLLSGIDHQTSARFSFLIALPIILCATASQAARLHHLHVGLNALQPALIGAVVAAVAAWLSTAFLMRYFRDHEAWALRPFAFYCIMAGCGSFLALVLL